MCIYSEYICVQGDVIITLYTLNLHNAYMSIISQENWEEGSSVKKKKNPQISGTPAPRKWPK